MGLIAYPPSHLYRQTTVAYADSITGNLWATGDVGTLGPTGFIRDQSDSRWEVYNRVTGVWSLTGQPPCKNFQQDFNIYQDEVTHDITTLGVTNLILGSTSAYQNTDVIAYDRVGTFYELAPSLGVAFGSANGGASLHRWEYNNKVRAVAFPSTAPRWEYSGGRSGTWSSGASSNPGVVFADFIFNAHQNGQPTVSGITYFGFATTTSGMITYNNATDTWGHTSTAPVSLNSNSILRVFDGVDTIYFIFRGLFVKYTISTNSWVNLAATSVQSLVPTFNQFGTAIATPSFIWGFGFSTNAGGGPSFGDILEYDVVNNVWTDTGDVMSTILTPQGAKIRFPDVRQDPFGPGYYLYAGGSSPVSWGSNNLDYWVPHGTPPPPPALGGNFVAMY